MAYNDLQMRAFSQIAYMDLEDKFEKYKTTTGTPVPLSKILSSSQKQKLLDLGVTQSELDSWSLSAVHNTNDANGFYACVIETSPGNASVAFRGSEGMGELDNVVNDWVGADLGLLNSTCTNQQAEVDRFLEKYKDLLNGYDNISMTGHSLGGNLAEYATIVSERYGLDDKIDQCVSLDGPGFSDEFIALYRDQIDKMSGRMKHYRWSFVGTMLNDLPGVDYNYVQVSNEANPLDDDKYNSFTRHDTKYLVYDENGNLVLGEQDGFSKFTSTLSEGLDHLPSIVGDALITVVGGIWISGMWAKENMFDSDGKLTPMGYGIIAGGVAIVSVFGLGAVVTAALAIVAAIVIVLAVAFNAELTYDLILIVIDAFCDMVEQIYNWAKEKVTELKNAIVSAVNKAKTWLNNNFNKGYKYANANPQITLDTYKMRNYAQRLQSVNRRIASIDSKLDSLYWKVGLLDLWNLIHADLLTGYSWRITRCVSYLNDTANEFDNVETSISNSL